ncbi:MAG: signal transduction histidine kinase, partial [Polyangiales bacterium]
MDPNAQEELERVSSIAGERLRQLTLTEELSGVGRWRVAVSGGMTWSPATFRIHGRDPRVGAPSLEEAIQLYHAKDRRRVARCLHRVLKDGGPYEFRARIERADGSIRYVSSAGRCECDASGAITGVVGIVQDVTAQAELESTRARLEHDERLIGLGRLAAGVAHEINNPLAYVEINLRALELDARRTFANAPEWSAVLRDCLDGVERIQTIISELDSFGRPALDADLHDMNDIATDAARLARSQLHSTTELRLHLGESSYIHGDKRRLAQVVLNLIRNADQALAPHAGRIDVFTQPHDGEAWLEVTDNGPGVPPELRRRIFEPFFTTKAPNKGTGLGLALSAEIMRRHDGELTLVNRGSFGACFRVVLPEAEVGAEAEFLPTITPVRHAHILIIDDEVALLNAYRRLLEPTHTLKTAESGLHALEILEGGADFDLIVCDLMMPEMDGPGLFEVVQQRWPHLA